MFGHVSRYVLPVIVLLARVAVDVQADDRPYVRVSPRDSRYFELADGRPYIPIGLNMVGVWAKAGEDEALDRMEGWMKSLSENGGNFVRVWLSSPFWDVEHRRCGEYDLTVGQRINRLFAMARKHNLYLKLTIEHFREINPDDPYAQRKPWATKSLHHVSRGGTAMSVDDWFTGEASRVQFRKKLDWYAERYGSDPIVFGWELWNEINAVRSRKYLPWTDVMLDELHRRFAKNLAMQSLGSFDRPHNRDQYQAMARLEGNDVAQVHRYLDLGANLEVCHGPVDVLTADAIRELIAMEPGKPIVLAESGAVEPSHTGPFKLYGKDKAGIILHDVIFAPFFAGAAGAGQCWHWQNYVDQNKLWWHFARFAKVVEGLDPVAENLRPAMVANTDLRVYVLKGRNTTLVWCRDVENSWQSELANGAPPRELKDGTIDMSPAGGLAGATARVYDPWKDVWTDIQPDGDAITLPPFKRSIVVKIVR
jgi:hypothetical protein